MQRTLVVIKPDAVQRKLAWEILGRFERKGLKVVALKMLRVSPEAARQMYAAHEGKEFYDRLMTFITAGPVVAAVVEGQDAIEVVRAMMGATCGREAQPGTIRGDFAMGRRYNLVHGSDSPESAGREIPVFFAADELLDYELIVDEWVYGD